MFDGVLTDGVFENIGNKFQVIQNSGMIISVRSGKAWFKSAWTYNNTDFPLTVSNSSLLEEPGQVSILFTDKTGTLTANQMQFKAIYVT